MSEPTKTWHEALGLKPTNLEGYYTRPAPRDGFHPLTATPEEIAERGFSPRPDKTMDPRGYTRWCAMYGRALKFIEPELQVREERFGPAESHIWAGKTMVAKEGQTFKSVHGVWMVPGVTNPAHGPYANADPGEWAAASWVGLDGFGNSTGDLIQAGTNQQTFGTNYYAWAQWVPAPSFQLNNMSVSPGDTVAVSVQVLTAGLPPDLSVLAIGEVTFLNQTQGVATSVLMIGAGEGASRFQGLTAEWILETPARNNTDLAPLAYFGMLAFLFGTVTDTKGNTLLAANGTSLEMNNGGVGTGRTGGSGGTVVAEIVAADDVFAIFPANGG